MFILVTASSISFFCSSKLDSICPYVKGRGGMLQSRLYDCKGHINPWLPSSHLARTIVCRLDSEQLCCKVRCVFSCLQGNLAYERGTSIKAEGDSAGLALAFITYPQVSKAHAILFALLTQPSRIANNRKHACKSWVVQVLENLPRPAGGECSLGGAQADLSICGVHMMEIQRNIIRKTPYLSETVRMWQLWERGT